MSRRVAIAATFPAEPNLMKRLLFFLTMVVAAAPVLAATRCGNRLVDEGDRDFRVRERCGEPFWSESWL
ncbi:MAG: DUF2845 domain-containing protein, partial [Xanthomonadales bacterium]|nr:DUF2845 domain-containing protein [Xanthomonadales bacterium]